MSNKITPVKLDVRGRVIPKGSTVRVAKWRVTFGKKITGGKKQRRFFETEREANKCIADTVAERKVKGNAAFSISDGLRVEALECLKKLDPFKASLTKAVDYFIAHANPPGGRQRVSDVVAEFMTARETRGCRKTTLSGYKCRLGKLTKQWGAKPINEIGRAELKKWILDTENSPKSRNNMIGDLSTLFNFALKERYCIENPAKDIERSILDDIPPGILTPSQARNLLLASAVEAPNLTAGLAIALFGGLRRSELCTLDWKEVDLKGRFITVTAFKAKTRQRRLVPISDNLAAWLQVYFHKDGPVLYSNPSDNGFTAQRRPLSVNSYGEQLRELIEAKPATPGKPRRPAIVSEWPDNALRHSFISYRLGKTKNENQTGVEAGTSPAMVYKHYREVVKPKDVEAYWNILPAGEATNIVPMTA
jgi:site-specific recombinase XerD